MPTSFYFKSINEICSLGEQQRLLKPFILTKMLKGLDETFDACPLLTSPLAWQG